MWSLTVLLTSCLTNCETAEWGLQNRPPRETLRLLLSELNQQGDKIARRAKFTASQAVPEKQMDDMQLEGLEERSEDSWLIPCVEVCPGAADGALSVAPEDMQGPGMQVEGARALLSTGKLFWRIGGGLSCGVP